MFDYQIIGQEWHLVIKDLFFHCYPNDHFKNDIIDYVMGILTDFDPPKNNLDLD